MYFVFLFLTDGVIPQPPTAFRESQVGIRIHSKAEDTNGENQRKLFFSLRMLYTLSIEIEQNIDIWRDQQAGTFCVICEAEV
jgi:hypothetical protein